DLTHEERSPARLHRASNQKDQGKDREILTKLARADEMGEEDRGKERETCVGDPHAHADELAALAEPAAQTEHAKNALLQHQQSLPAPALRRVCDSDRAIAKVQRSPLQFVAFRWASNLSDA